VIQRAYAACDEVVLISYAKPEMPGCPPELREQWLAARFPDALRLVVTEERLRSWTWLPDRRLSLPENDAGATHHEFCAFLCQRVLGLTVDAAFTSEPYGDEFAADLTRCFRVHDPAAPAVRHVMVDPDRAVVPASGTALRYDVQRHRDWLAPEVYASFVRGRSGC